MDFHLNQYYKGEIYRNDKNEEMPYRILFPVDYDKGNKEVYPLVVFLHGSEERGNDNEKQLNNAAHRFTDYEIRHKYPSFVVFPQCPQKEQWMNARRYFDRPVVEYLPKASKPIRLVMELINILIHDFAVNRRRIYIAGLSMGGFGVYDILARFPSQFGAAIAICGGGDIHYAKTMKNIPLWIAHGEKDKNVPVEMSRVMVDAIRKTGGDPVYTEFPDVEHNAWDPLLYDKPEIFEWLYSKGL